jgi:hypothetical protein
VTRPGWRTYTIATWRLPRLRLLVSFRDRAQRDAGGVSYRGPFRTVRGDHVGTFVGTFLRHWPGCQLRYGTVPVGLGSVIVGRTTFLFGNDGRLYGIELGVTPVRFPVG